MPFSVRSNTSNPWLHRFAVLTALATLALIGIGGLVTSHEAGMAVPDWPTSAGYNMFALPIKFWKGGVFYEHTHRLWATVVGTLVVVLTRWLGGYASRRPLAIIGLIEILGGFGIFLLLPDLKGTGHFLTGIGGVVLLAGLVWAKNEPANQTLTRLGWLAFGLVQFQGLLGGLRVVLLKDQIGIFHAALAQIFFVLLCMIAVLTSRRWDELLRLSPSAVPRALRYGIIAATLMIFGQLILGATMRHQHAGLAISDFPLAYGKLWPATDAESIARYNQQRIEITLANPITAFQIELQMAHRIMAILILAAVAFCAWQARRFGLGRSDRTISNTLYRIALFWVGLIFVQATLGAATVLLGKAADIATAHVLFGALSLANGALLCIIATGFNLETTRHANFLSRADSRPENSGSFAATTSAR
jgi:cytochrome c oxidase assembly protein subunit 15